MPILHHKTLAHPSPAPPVVILHGLFGMLDNWMSIGKQIAQHRQVILVDQRNHGRSFHSTDHNYWLMANDLLVLLDELAIDKCHLIGHSMGGKTAMHFAGQYPNRVEKMLVVDIAPKYYPPHHQSIIHALQTLYKLDVRSRKEAEKFMSDQGFNSAVTLFLLKNLYRVADAQYGIRCNIQALSANIESIGEASLDNLSPIDVPVIFLAGGQSNYIKEGDLETIKTVFPLAELIKVPKAGHWIHAEQPQVILEALAQF